MECGEDGCGGSCGTCPDGKECMPTFGLCLGGGEGFATGILQFEYRTADINGSNVSLGGIDILPAVNQLVTITDSEGKLLGSREVKEPDGRFSVPLTRELQAGDRLLLSAMWAPTDQVVLAVLKPASGGLPNQTYSPIWAWTRKIGPGTDVGTITITEAEGSGALFVFLINHLALTSILDHMLEGDEENIIRLGILWAPDVEWYCGACFSDVHQTTPDGPSLYQSIFISGDSFGPSCWGWPILLHELGHYVADSYSADDSPGGAHSIWQSLIPPFAWSEGWATFFGLWTASRWFGIPMSVYWDIRKDHSLWTDYDQLSNFIQPVSAAGQEQDLSEAWVTSALWHLWKRDEVDGLGFGTRVLDTPTIFGAMGSHRFLDHDRAAQGVDFVDFLDAVVCQEPAVKGEVEGAAQSLGFPYDGKAECPATTGRALPSSTPARANAHPSPPLDLTLGVREEPGTTEYTARIRVLGRVPAPVKLRIDLPKGAKLTSGRLEENLGFPAPGTVTERTFRVRGQTGPVRVTLESSVDRAGIRVQAVHPPEPSGTSRPVEMIPIPPTRLHDATITRAVLLR